jgi:hypothetical protein
MGRRSIWWRDAGWLPALIGALLAGGFGFGLVVGLRAISGLDLFQTERTGYPHLVVSAITAPLGFIWGMGCFELLVALGPRRSDRISNHDQRQWSRLGFSCLVVS